REPRRERGRDPIRLRLVDVRQLRLIRERLRDRRLVEDVPVDQQIDEIDPLLPLDGVQRLEPLDRNARAPLQNLSEEALLHGYFSIFSMFLTAGFTLTGGVGAAPPGEGVAGVGFSGVVAPPAPPVEGRTFCGISSGCCGSWTFGVFGRA